MADPFVAIVTGASSGIGDATARRLAREPGAKLVLVARRRDRLEALAREIGGATVVAVDLTAPDAPAEVLAAVARAHGELHLLVNNAGARWAGEFAETGWENVARHMKVNFDAPVRLTETLLPLLRSTAKKRARPVSIVNVSSTSGRVARRGTGGYSASKFALAGWSDSLAAEERPYGVHVGLVLPGFVSTEGFPQAELVAHPLLRWIVSKPEIVAEAIVECGLGGKAERYAPSPYWIAAAARILAPRLVRRATAGKAFTPATGADGQD
ncbi:MAG TPA: SDR family NAD(P)-dependent oxidoreductase [Solirubrobacteraceae bacterium]|nr:SDR family NAD(P)-dependent oxidoreductase [Solirubrobacteraceae bacterium]